MVANVKSIHTKRLPVKAVRAGQTAAFALKKIKRSQLRKGMVMVDPSLKPRSCREFEAEVLVLYHSTTISSNYQAVIHCGVAQQTARLVDLDKEYIRTGDKAKVRFRFMYWPEYVKEGSRLIFREGRTKGIGRITRIIPEEEELGDQAGKKNRKGSKPDAVQTGETAGPSDGKEEQKAPHPQEPKKKTAWGKSEKKPVAAAPNVPEKKASKEAAPIDPKKSGEIHKKPGDGKKYLTKST
eukprot:TRINITY_DN1678_c0_g1_i3.p1 TRINITY_DN1678_c0_g1~~TRINITY_DN1678_c0_g1_i3.p1  ORF type:complete len:239 (-),score=82.14 TRINITY_DN1678_c0_g1_i3:44-760(-)